MSTKISPADVSRAPAAIPIPAPVSAPAGRIVNPTLADSQVIGAVTQGLGGRFR